MTKQTRFIIFVSIFAAMFIAMMANNVYGDIGLSIEAIAIEGDTQITIGGTTDRVDQDVTLIVRAPNGNIVTIAQIEPEADGIINTTINTNSPLWNQDGVYTISAQQLDNHMYNVSMEVEIEDGAVVPEFGHIAMMILAVSIVSIVAITAKAKFIPRF